MLISEDGNFIFVHIQKTAGTSLRQLFLQEYPDSKELLRHHSVVSEGTSALQASWSRYYKFAFVRNPWDRVLSYYSMVMTKDSVETLPFWHMVTNKSQYNMLWQYLRKNTRDFNDFVERIVDVSLRHPVDMLASRLVLEKRMGVGRSNLFSQLDCLRDSEGNIGVDYIAKVEDIDCEVRNILKAIGHPNYNSLTINQLNRSDRKPYQEVYTDKTRDIIYERCREDIEYFGYEY